MTQVQLAAELGDRYSGSMVSMVENNRSALLLDGAARAAKALGVSLDWLVGLTDDPSPAARRTSRSGGHPRALAPVDQPGARPIPVRELAAAAGVGAIDLDESIRGYLYFRREWLDRRAVDPTRADVIKVRGESMEPTLPDGCSVLLDRRRRSPRDGRIYVARTDEGVVVKRLQRVSGRWTLTSDHPAWRTETLLADADVIGEVRWMAQTI